MAKIVADSDGNRHAVLRYSQFQALGLESDPPVPSVCVPLFDRVEEWLHNPLEYAAEEDAKLLDSARLARRAMPAVAAELGRPSSAWLRASVGAGYKLRSVMPGLLFRGEPKDTLGLIPTLFRIPHGANPEQVVAKRLIQRRQSARLVRFAAFVSKGMRLSPGQAAAVARHYGVPSCALDFTYDPRVAATFALAGQRSSSPESRQQVAILYALELDRIAEIGLTKAWKPNADGGSDTTIYGLPAEVIVPYDTFDERTRQVVKVEARISMPEPLTSARIQLRTALVPGIERIERQQGAFLEPVAPGHWNHTAQLWYLLDFLAIKWCLAADADHAGREQLLDGYGSLFPADGRVLSWLGRRLGQ